MDREVKVFKPKFSEVKVSEENGVGYVEGYASVFGNIDSMGEVVEKGAFAKTLKENLVAGKIKFVDFHNSFLSSEEIIGVVEEAKEDEHGLWFKARLSAVQRAQDVRTKIKEGILDALSIGYNVIEDRIDDEIRYLKELKLWEISVVPWGANELAGVTNVKGAIEAELEKLDNIKDLDINQEEFAEVIPAIKAVIDNLKALIEKTGPAGTTQSGDESPENSEGPAEDHPEDEEMEKVMETLEASFEEFGSQIKELLVYRQLNDFGKSLKSSATKGKDE